MASKAARSGMGLFKLWTTDTGTFPIVIICSFAAVAAGASASRYLLHNPDVRFDKSKRNNSLHYETENGAEWRARRFRFANLHRNAINQSRQFDPAFAKEENKGPQRKRSRLETTPRRSGKRKSSGSAGANRTPGSSGNEAKIVWKDSPADKQIRVSGTGKMAVRREMQGFVGRLARASQQSPPCTQEEEKIKTRERSRAKRKAGMTLKYEEHSTSRHLLFSPESRRAGEEQKLPSPGNRRQRSTPEKADSQEELFSVLDKMEQKYASPGVTIPSAESKAAFIRARLQSEMVTPATTVERAKQCQLKPPKPQRKRKQRMCHRKALH
ncbi:hypothetical protein BBO99_00000512 [Phytophthora kernoviae]|uniref:Uncharacterized protein n=1 Tax=Phytophthora kernoviae TaxID=325452 RepID=A0A3R7K3Y5_9STRA|nr:hypothetical protein BBI17_000551 [Phytophthora kernoviae]RLN85439.1 hypothetical protein BBO99_00000512 [Phytophthora kernoviae]